MIGRVVDIATDGKHISVERGFLVVSEKGIQLGRVPLDDIAGVIAHAHGITYTNNLLVELAKRGIPAILCGANHSPAAVLWPVDGHHEQCGRMSDQTSAALPLKKRLWAQLVRAKILAQAATLSAVGASHAGFYLLARKVQSGDPKNVEAEAARRYWTLLFGNDFRRDKDGDGLNGMLNYGYAVLRAGVARAVMGAGLHPSFGLMHSNRSNAMVLVDDLMEPFRPIVDLEVWRLAQEGKIEVAPDVKTALARMMVIDLVTAEGVSPLVTCAERLVQSLVKSYSGETGKLALPKSVLLQNG